MEQDSHAAQTSPVAFVQENNGKQAVDLKASAKALQSAKSSANAAFDVAQKSLDKAMDDIQKGMDSEVQAIGSAITKAQEEEIKGVRASSGSISLPEPPAPKKKALRPSRSRTRSEHA